MEDAARWGLHCVTFNLNARWDFDEETAKKLLRSEGPSDFSDTDVISLGFQEVPMTAGSLTGYGNDPIAPVVNPILSRFDFVQLLPGSMLRQMGIMLLVYVKRKHLGCVATVEYSNFRSGDILDVVGNKGAVACQITLVGGTKLTFLSCHFTAQHQNLAKRIQEYHSIDQTLTFGNAPKPCWNDYTIWTGDFNFRVNYSSIEDAIDLLDSNSPQHMKTLLQHDQLTQCKQQSEVFQNFYEGDVTFKPTYRYYINSAEYDKLRQPSWCDRVLWSVKEVVGSAPGRSANLLLCRLLSYQSIEDILISDHKPVFARFDINVGPLDVQPRWRVTFPPPVWFADQANVCQFSIDDSERPRRSVWDWVGLYKHGFTSTHNYLTYMTLWTSWEEPGGITKLTFGSQYLTYSVGMYQLGYYSSSRRCLIGLSQPFQITHSLIETATDAYTTMQGLSDVA